MKYLKKLWRRLFPVRVEYVPQYQSPDLALNSEYKDFLPELTRAQRDAPSIFHWSYIRLQKLEVEFHERPEEPTKEALFAYGVRQYALSERIEDIKTVIKLPASASRLLESKKGEKKDKKEKRFDNWGEN
jgi:hypothetical protein